MRGNHVTYLLMAACSGFILGTTHAQHDERACYNCYLQITSPTDIQGDLRCASPTPEGLHTTLAPCPSGRCRIIYYADSAAEKGYISRSCDPGCINSKEFLIPDIGVGEVTCCEGHLCNGSVKQQRPLTHSLILFTLALSLLILNKN